MGRLYAAVVNGSDGVGKVAVSVGHVVVVCGIERVVACAVAVDIVARGNGECCVGGGSGIIGDKGADADVASGKGGVEVGQGTPCRSAVGGDNGAALTVGSAVGDYGGDTGGDSGFVADYQGLVAGDGDGVVELDAVELVQLHLVRWHVDLP